MNRRAFMKRAAGASASVAAGLTILADARSARATPANDRIALAVMGIRARGTNVAAVFAGRPDCRIAYLCDVDSNLFPKRVERIAKVQGGVEPVCVQDFRKTLDDKSIDALVIATPDHWHCLAAIWACQAGKDVYVEKPLSHSVWEGRKVVEAARKYQRIVQVGTQGRSAAYIMSAKKYLAEGRLGKIHFCRIYDQKGEYEIPYNVEAVPDSDPPEGFDWEMWNGPAPEARYNANYINHWHILWRYSSGDIINDSYHQIDLARMLMGVDYPKTVYSTGLTFDRKGIAESPQTQAAIFEYDDLLMTFEMTLYTPYMLKTSPYIRQSLDEYPYWLQNADRIEIYGSEGLMIVGRQGGGWQVFGRPKREVPVVIAQDNGQFPDPEHTDNFIQCMKSRERPNADVEEGHLTAFMIHCANISYRLGGQKLLVDPKTERFIDNPKADEFLKRTYRKPWVVPEEV